MDYQVIAIVAAILQTQSGVVYRPSQYVEQARELLRAAAAAPERARASGVSEAGAPLGFPSEAS
jgi:hypothetical protein